MGARARTSLVFAVALLTCAAALAQESTTERPNQGLLRLAPKGTWAVARARPADIFNAPAFGAVRVHLGRTSDAPDLAKVQEVALFALPPVPDEFPHESPNWCGIVLAGPESGIFPPDPSADAGQLAGMQTFPLPRGIAAPPEEDTLLIGSDRGALSAMVEAWRSGQGARMSEGLHDLLEQAQGYGAVVAAALPEPLGSVLSVEDAERLDPPLERARGVALGLRAAESATVHVTVAFNDPESAAEAREQAIRRIGAAQAKLRERMQESEDPWGASMMHPLASAYERIEIESEGRNLRARLTLQQQELMMVGMAAQMALRRARTVAGIGRTQRSGASPRPRPGAVPRRKLEARKRAGKLNLHNIALGLAMYEAAHGRFPPDLESILEESFVDDAAVFIDQNDTELVERRGEGEEFRSSYVYVGPYPKKIDPATIVVYTRPGIYEDGRNVLYVDGGVGWLTEQQLRDPDGSPRTSLAASYRAMVEALGEALTEERDAELREFYEVAD